MIRLHLPTLALALALPLASLPATADAALPGGPILAMAKKKPKKPAAAAEPEDTLSAAEAQERRTPIQTAARAKADGGDPAGAGESLASAARKFGDPVLFLDAAEAFKAAAAAARNSALAQRAAEEARVGLDILYFLSDARHDTTWEIVASSQVSAETSRGRDLVSASEDLAEEIEREKAAPAASGDEGGRKERAPAPRDGRGLIAAGSVLTVVGLGGLGLMGAGLAMGLDAQKTVEDPTVFGDAFDEADAKGKRGNLFAIIGASVGAVGVISGVTLLALGVKKRKAYRADNPVAHLRVAPTLGGLTLSGRF